MRSNRRKDKEVLVFSNGYKLSETLDTLKYCDQSVTEDAERTAVVMTEISERGYGIRHYLVFHRFKAGWSMEGLHPMI